ncbi:MAG: M20/M25/M40 family metallo-hydrolase [Deltaproteobacteria bacterium]|nr:MAG: M20/M25/M40 family metallo-hydrolase [Deltaproteobacteria bacterium]
MVFNDLKRSLIRALHSIDNTWKNRAPRAWISLIGVSLFGLSALLIVTMQQPPSPKPAKASAKEFSAIRAMTHVKSMAKKPHPMWSKANVEVRRYLLQQLRQLGRKPLIQQRPLPRYGLHPRASRLAGKPVTNVMVRMRGTKSTGALLVAAHYDSAHRGPGAADDGAAVAAMLETIRALKHHPALANDVIFLFTDAEEIGLWGAKLFARYHPWMKDVKLVLNFEARGAAGPSLMFETASNNGFVMEQFAKGDPAPRGSSLFFEVYRRLPNDTDFTVFKRAGVQGLNFAFIEQVRHYHQPTDDAEHLSRASLQDHGEHMLSLVRTFGAANLGKVKTSPNVVYFDVLGRHLVRYSELAGKVLAGFALLACFVLLLLSMKSRQIRWKGLGFAFVQLVGTAALAGSVVGGLAWYTLRWRGKHLYGFYYDILHDGWYVLAFLFLTASFFFAVHGWLSRWIRKSETAMMALLWWAGVSVFLAWKVPGAGYLTIWPLLGGVLAFTFVHGKHKEKVEDEASFLSVVGWICEWPLLLLVIPLLYHIPYALTLTMTAATSVLFVLFFSLAFATQEAWEQAGKWKPVVVTFALFVVCYTVPLILS